MAPIHFRTRTQSYNNLWQSKRPARVGQERNPRAATALNLALRHLLPPPPPHPPHLLLPPPLAAATIFLLLLEEGGKMALLVFAPSQED